MAGAKGRSGRPRKPTASHKADGTYQKCRHEGRGDTIPADGFPHKPEGMTPAQDRVWETVANRLPEGCLGEIDTASMTEMVAVYGFLQDAKSQLADDPTDKDARIAYSTYFDRWMKLATEFGMTPVARAKLAAPKSQGDSPLKSLTSLLESRN